MGKMSPIRHFIAFLWLVGGAVAGDGWQTVDEGFRFSLPQDWKKEEVRGIDSHVGKYVGNTAYLIFDGVHGLGLTVKETERVIKDLQKKEVTPTLLKTGQEIWRVGGRIASFEIGEVDSKRVGREGYRRFALLHVPTPGEPAYLQVYIMYSSTTDLPTIRRILMSFRWPNEPNSERSDSP